MRECVRKLGDPLSHKPTFEPLETLDAIEPPRPPRTRIFLWSFKIIIVHHYKTFIKRLDAESSWTISRERSRAAKHRSVIVAVSLAVSDGSSTSCMCGRLVLNFKLTRTYSTSTCSIDLHLVSLPVPPVFPPLEYETMAMQPARIRTVRCMRNCTGPLRYLS